MRALCTWVALSALFGAYAAPAVHALTSEHVTCAEHGELIEASEHGPGELQLLDPTDETRRITRSSRPARAHGHDHCALASHTTPAAACLLFSWTGALAVAIELPVHRAADNPQSRALFRLAPKQSPPSLA